MLKVLEQKNNRVLIKIISLSSLLTKINHHDPNDERCLTLGYDSASFQVTSLTGYIPFFKRKVKVVDGRETICKKATEPSYTPNLSTFNPKAISQKMNRSIFSFPAFLSSKVFYRV